MPARVIATLTFYVEEENMVKMISDCDLGFFMNEETIADNVFNFMMSKFVEKMKEERLMHSWEEEGIKLDS